MDNDTERVLYGIGDQLTNLQRQMQKAEKQRDDLLSAVKLLARIDGLMVKEMRKLALRDELDGTTRVKNALNESARTRSAPNDSLPKPRP